MSSSLPVGAAATKTSEADDRPARLGRLGPVLCFASLSWILPITAGATLVQARLGQWDDHSKFSRYAAMATAGALVAMLANIVIGALCDRTRSRWGRRNPWILAGGIVTATVGSALSFAHGFPALLILWICLQAGLNAVVGPLTAVLPDRVGPEQLGKASARVGIGLLVGQSLGVVAAGLTLTEPAQGLRWLPWLTFLGALAVWFGAPDRSNRDEARAPLSLRALARSVLPPRDGDFQWALVGRLLALLGLLLVTVYQLYVLTDLLHLTTVRAGSVIALAGVLTAVMAGIGNLVSGSLSDRIGRRKPFVIGAAALGAAGIVPLLVAPSLGCFFAFVVSAGFGYGCYTAVDQALMAQVLPSSENRAKDLGILNIANTMPQVLAPILAAAVVPAAGYRALFALAIVSATAGALCIVPIRRVR